MLSKRASAVFFAYTRCDENAHVLKIIVPGEEVLITQIQHVVIELLGLHYLCHGVNFIESIGKGENRWKWIEFKG